MGLSSGATFVDLVNIVVVVEHFYVWSVDLEQVFDALLTSDVGFFDYRFNPSLLVVQLMLATSVKLFLFFQ